MADIFDVLADSTRREILATLLQRSAGAGELSVGELVEAIGVSQPTVSKHLQRLREHGLVSVRTEGQHHLSRIEPEPLREVERWIGDFLAEDPHDGYPGSAAFAAWSGADAGESLGRRLADGTHQARAAVEDAAGRVKDRLPRLGRR